MPNSTIRIQSDKPTKQSSTGLSLTKSILTINGLIATIFVAAWIWLSWQMDFLLNQRTDELGHQLAEVTAFASAEAVIAEDEVYLNALIKRINQKEFVEQVAIHRVDGTLLVQTKTQPTNQKTTLSSNTTNLDEENSSDDGLQQDNLQQDDLQQTTAEVVQRQNQTQTLSDPIDKNWTDWVIAYLPSYQTDNTLYMATINWEGSDVGWVQVTLNRGLIESDIRKASYTLSLFTLAAFLIISLLSALILWHRHNKIKSMLLEHQNTQPQSPLDKSEVELSNLHQTALQLKHNRASNNHVHFKNVTSDRNTTQLKNIVHQGYIMIVRIIQSDHNRSNTQLIAVTDTAQHMLSDIAAYLSLNFYCTDRDQTLLTASSNKSDDVIKLVYLLLNLNKALNKRKQLGLSFNALLDNTQVTLYQTDAGIIKAENGHLTSLLSQFRRLKHAIWIAKSAAKNMPLSEQNDSIFSNNIVIENNTDKTLTINEDTQSLLERFANSLVTKYFPETNT